jgi:hypothetical protein
MNVKRSFDISLVTLRSHEGLYKLLCTAQELSRVEIDTSSSD